MDAFFRVLSLRRGRQHWKKYLITGYFTFFWRELSGAKSWYQNRKMPLYELSVCFSSALDPFLPFFHCFLTNYTIKKFQNMVLICTLHREIEFCHFQWQKVDIRSTNCHFSNPKPIFPTLLDHFKAFFQYFWANIVKINFRNVFLC